MDCPEEATSHAKKSDVLQGTLDLMILKTLEAMGPLHGFGIARRLEQLSDEVRLNEGTVYTSLMRLQQAGWIAAKWGASENNVSPASSAACYGWKDRSRDRETARHSVAAAALRRTIWNESSEAEFQAEIEEHVRLLAARHRRQGMDDEPAMLAARRARRSDGRAALRIGRAGAR